MSHGDFVAGHRGPAFVDEEVLCCVFHGNRIFVARDANGLPQLPNLEARRGGLSLKDAHYLGRLDGRHCYGLQLPQGTEPPAGLELLGLRALILEGN